MLDKPVRGAFELHAQLSEHGQLEVELVWARMGRLHALGTRHAYTISQHANEDRPSFLDRVESVMCELRGDS